MIFVWITPFAGAPDSKKSLRNKVQQERWLFLVGDRHHNRRAGLFARHSPLLP
jgi:hypothetical protein